MLKTTPGAPIVINVSLDTNRDPPVSVDPPVLETSGPAKIIWQIARDSAIKNFYFFPESLDFATGSSVIDKQIQGHRCSVFNTGAAKTDAVYALTVEHEGKYYGTGIVEQFGSRAPCIRNK